MITVDTITKRYGDKVAVDSLSFTVQPGVITGFLGPNGAGKSTTMRMIMGLDSPTSGHATVNGRSLAEHRAPLHEVGALLDANAVHGGRSAVNHLRCLALSNGIGPRRVVEVLEQVGLAASVGDLSPAELSGGMQKRVALARAVAARPEIVFFDEPTTGLDPIMGSVIDGLIADVVKRLGATALSITHDIASARRIADTAAMIHKGRIVWTGPAASLGQTGNAMVDQFAKGEREGPIQMELRR